MSDLLTYYQRRANEYDRIYAKPERQSDLAALSQLVRDWTKGRRVLELACGTGWWTRVIAESAESIVATDANDEVLRVAQTRTYAQPVDFRIANAFCPEEIEGEFDLVLAGFWVSHLDVRNLGGFLERVDAVLPARGRVVLLDNSYVEGSSTPLSREDEHGNTYQKRTLQDGQEYEVMKNFFTSEGMTSQLDAAHRFVDVRQLEYFWASVYDIAVPS